MRKSCARRGVAPFLTEASPAAARLTRQSRWDSEQRGGGGGHRHHREPTWTPPNAHAIGALKPDLIIDQFYKDKTAPQKTITPVAYYNPSDSGALWYEQLDKIAEAANRREALTTAESPMPHPAEAGAGEVRPADLQVNPGPVQRWPKRRLLPLLPRLPDADRAARPGPDHRGENPKL
ncbi:hypothetical protein [Streptomyces zagrosensis]|uniref:Uncharacterized protein n=1 Tax=Streptomyces zagrosensis TaxID=1042984 RepID=A0A7W9Q845_9ACTN|nr:hypothetical protein [Streptomyces zagrosensis]MBB5935351.1 hypothetical protein [Streptomyces zagrosensis]